MNSNIAQYNQQERYTSHKNPNGSDFRLFLHSLNILFLTFTSAWMSFIFMRFASDVIPGFVQALSIMACSFIIASLSLQNWLRVACDSKIRTPSFVNLFLCLTRTACLTSSGSHSASFKLNLICTLVFSLLTFCPPGPVLFEYFMSSFSTGILPYRVRNVSEWQLDITENAARSAYKRGERYLWGVIGLNSRSKMPDLNIGAVQG